MIDCRRCGRKAAARAIGFCPNCLRALPVSHLDLRAHGQERKKLCLPETPPQNSSEPACRLCTNKCRPAPGRKGFCGLRKNEGGRIKSILSPRFALAHAYLDPLPTNCCASWFCEGSKKKGYNLAVFFYGCSFDCLFCQNHSHKNLDRAPLLEEEEVVARALDPRVRCVCFFGGSAEQQLPFALRVSRKIIAASGSSKQICWEWNGSARPELALEAAKISAMSGGTVKFDLKAFHPSISLALCGVSTGSSFENFALLARRFRNRNLLTATTLLVPSYIDGKEVGEIARFIASLDPSIPYSLLVFHPDYLLTDLPVTPRKQVEECLAEASRHIENLYLGNRHLLW